MTADPTTTSSSARALADAFTASQPPNLLRKIALAGFAAVCEALYPDNDFGAPSWRDTEMIRRAAELWDELPPASRLMLESLYAGLELGGAALAPGVGRLSSLSIETRYRMLDRMRTSRVWPLRFVAEALKSSSTMVYMSHPTVHAYIGATSSKASAFARLLEPAARVARPLRIVKGER